MSNLPQAISGLPKQQGVIDNIVVPLTLIGVYTTARYRNRLSGVGGATVLNAAAGMNRRTLVIRVT